MKEGGRGKDGERREGEGEGRNLVQVSQPSLRSPAFPEANALKWGLYAQDHRGYR